MSMIDVQNLTYDYGLNIGVATAVLFIGALILFISGITIFCNKDLHI